MKPFIYSIDGHAYKLVPEYTTGSAGRIWITGCQMFDMADQYLGYWYRHNMPAIVLRDALKHVKRTVVALPVNKTPKQKRMRY